MIRHAFLAVFLVALLPIPSIAAAADSSLPDLDSPERQGALKLQLFLDREGFGPGRLDGLWGEFTRKATLRWNEANPDRKIPLGEKEEPDWKAVSIPWEKSLTTDYTPTEADRESLGTVPSDPADMAEQESLPYTSLLELVSEKFHAYPDYIRELNGLDTDADLEVGQAVEVPNVAGPFDLEMPKEAKNEKKEETQKEKEKKEKDAVDDPDREPLEIRVDRDQEILEARRGGELIYSFPVTPGASSNPAPPGDWEVVTVAWMPTFRYDEQMLEEGTRSDTAHILPPGPNNPVGILWIGLNSEGIGIHGTSNPDDIGRNASHGCMRLANWDAYLLGREVDLGAKVHIE